MAVNLRITKKSTSLLSFSSLQFLQKVTAFRYLPCHVHQSYCTEKKRSLLTISSLNVTKSALSCRISHIYWKIASWENSFAVHCLFLGRLLTWKLIELDEFSCLVLIVQYYFLLKVRNLFWKYFISRKRILNPDKYLWRHFILESSPRPKAPS